MKTNGASLPDAVLDRQRDSWLSGNPSTVMDLLRSGPFEHDREAWLDLVYNEIVIQEELGLKPSLDIYVARYPDLADDLRLHFEVHNAVRDSAALLDTPDLRYDDSWPESRTTSPDQAGELPEYELTRVLGHGGMATVYLARHRRLHRDVALKMFKAGWDITDRERFRIRTEAEAMARLAHPNILQIYEIGEIRGAPYLAVEYAEHGTLAQRLQRMPLDSHAAAELIETLARALHVAHERHVVHRDLKPANILFGQAGTPKIADFGLAKVLLDSQVSAVEATRTGETMGTPRYMAPEQAAGNTELLGPTTDIYALGNLLYECLTGRAPFVSSNVVETVRMICDDDPLPLRKLQPGIPRDLETICLRCLEKTPAKRYASALELAEDLRRFRQHEPIFARPMQGWERALKWCRRHVTETLITGGVFLVVFALIFGMIFKVQMEQRRLQTLRSEIAEKMLAGREAVDRDELEVAQALFHEAWLTVQAEPQLSDHETSVSGWLDHTRTLMNRYQWKQRVPPREFDERRDSALLQSLLIIPDRQEPLVQAKDAIQRALEFTIAGDSAWKIEREQLTLLNSELIEMDRGPNAACQELDATREFSSHAFHTRRAELLWKLNRSADASLARQQADAHPPRKTFERFHAGMRCLRQRDLAAALEAFEDVLQVEPEHFAARLFQAITLLQMERPREAKIALTACIAQRPRFMENYYFRALAHHALRDFLAATHDLDNVLNDRHADDVRYSAQLERGRWELMRGDFVAAMTWFRLATANQPEELAGWRHLGWSQLAAGQSASALESFEVVTCKHSQDSEAALGAAFAHASLGHLKPLRDCVHQFSSAAFVFCQHRFQVHGDNRALLP